MKKVMFLLLLYLPLFGDIAVSLPAKGSETSSLGDVTSLGKWSSSNGGFQIGWNITQSGSTYNYIYSVSQVNGGSLDRGVSTFILELNPSITASNLATVITSSSLPSSALISGPRTFSPGDSGSSSYPFLPGSVYGVEFSGGGDGTFNFSFTSTNAPVWGSFYADNGQTGKNSGYAYNSSFSSNPDSSTKDFSNWIPTVGGPSVIAPEPSTMLFLGTTLAFALYIKRKKLMSV